MIRCESCYSRRADPRPVPLTSYSTLVEMRARAARIDFEDWPSELMGRTADTAAIGFAAPLARNDGLQRASRPHSDAALPARSIDVQEALSRNLSYSINLRRRRLAASYDIPN
jgi:hypothetical protein